MFYKLVELSSDVTAKGIFETVRNAFQAEGVDFLSYFKENLVAFASDGEPTMAGQNNGLVALIRKEVNHPVFSIHCMAHRLELAIKKAFTKHEYFTRFEKTINNLFIFYNDNTLKRKAHLREMAMSMNEKVYELNYIYHIRWISSEFQSIKNLKKMWKVLVADLTKISDGNEFKRDVKIEATKLQRLLLSKHFLVILYFISDVLETLSFWSQRMQQRTALLVELADFRELIIESFENLKHRDGRDMGIFISKLACKETACGTVEDIYDNNYVVYENQHLNNDNDDEVPHLPEIRYIFLDAIIEQMKLYFPSPDIKNFKVFRPKEIPTNVGVALTHGVFEINKICDVLKLGECVELVVGGVNSE